MQAENFSIIVNPISTQQVAHDKTVMNATNATEEFNALRPPHAIVRCKTKTVMNATTGMWVFKTLTPPLEIILVMEELENSHRQVSLERIITC